MLEGGPHVLPAFPDSLREAALGSLERLEVEARTGSVVTEVDADGVSWRPTSVGLQPGGQDAKGGRIEAQTVLWAAGIAASPLTASLGVPLDGVGRVRTESTLTVPGHPNTFVVGDMCALEQDGRWLPGVAQVAKQEGAHSARNILRAIAGQSLERFRYRDYGTMAVIGRGRAVADLGPFKASGFFAWLFWLFLHLFWLIGFRNRLAVMGEWAWAYVTLQRRVRLITGGRRETEKVE